MNSKPRKIAKKVFWVAVSLWLIAFIWSQFTANVVVDVVGLSLIPIWAFLAWYGWDDSNITLEDIRQPMVIDVEATDVKKEKKLLP